MTAAGFGLVLVALTDIFSTLWVPTGRGRLTRWVMSSTWRVLRRASAPARTRGLLDRAGPAAMIAVIVVWAALLVLGCALVYGPHLPGSFSYPPGSDPGTRSVVVDALYVSAVGLATLGLGDIVPTAAWLRLVVPLQALLGFVLLTAVVSWVLQVYPALSRRRTLSLRLSQLERAADGDPGRAADTSTRAQLLHDLAADVAQVRVDLSQYAETYYYRDGDREVALPVSLGWAHALAVRASGSSQEDVRLAGDELGQALEHLVALLRGYFGLTGDDVGAVLRGYAVDQRHHPAAALL
ncbi:potassium channel family protein [Jannaschia sp. R86511]|uniref:potassium channel family protein n=1 Tax=Jannaschia sp. R86511 TaxID=3093853 RepID=UPI0036D3FDD7